MTIPSSKDLLDVAIEAAWAAGRHTLAWFNTSVEVELKADETPVTRADREAEQIARAVIARHFPDHGILGEEFGETQGRVPVRWILDPIDGTKTFVRGVPLYGTLVGVEVDGDPVAGAIYMPALDEMVAGAPGLGATWNGRPCSVSDVASLSEAMALCYDQTVAQQQIEGYARLVERTKLQRTWGDCYAYVLVATGRGEIVVDANMAVWDCAALLPVIEAAGGRFTDRSGNRTIRGRSAVATNGKLHDEVLELVGT